MSGNDTSPATDALIAIHGGQCDDNLSGIVEACNMRRQALAAIRAAELDVKAGQTVWLSDRMRPKYLSGAECTVERVTETHVIVTMPDDPYLRRYSGRKGIECPKTIIVTA